MKLARAIESFTEVKRRVGLSYRESHYTLLQFLKQTGDKDLNCITEQEIINFVYSGTVSSKTRSARFTKVKKLFEWARDQGCLSVLPMPPVAPKLVNTFTPYIYSRDELKHIFFSAGSLNDRSSPMQGDTLKAFLVTIYACGLRLSEGLNIRLCDVDFERKTIIILETKFKKSRILPFGNQLETVLRDYRDKRIKYLPLPQKDKSYFFVSRNGNRFSSTHISHMFERVRKLANIYVPTRDQQPRLHDLRHTYAVHKLTEWYEQGENVQKLIYNLSTYMGHKDLEDTKVYLTMTKDFLQIVSNKFEQFIENGAQQ